ncbi:putative helix-turn-helix XRE-family like protein [Candidatus Defluviicoccus seviourii]|uniref:Helix-turn-helix XRE-family like protein n=1 Tax=Candidatus Defluviicoccus seviourii TaxID=2565273 RepID=A0A564WIV1_9PROT|nr:putative helix-turn-helix XRE-family like protein [Candidatus Defluviicoccus seviourii]
MDVSQRERLADALRRAGHGSKAALAAVAGVHPSAVRKWLSGDTDPSFSAIAAGCRELSVSLDWLAYGQEPGAPVEIDIPLLIEIGAAVEAALAEAGRELPPLKRLEVAAHHYCDVVGRTRAADPVAIRRLLRLVA